MCSHKSDTFYQWGRQKPQHAATACPHTLPRDGTHTKLKCLTNLAALALATASQADPLPIQNHPAQMLYLQEPCQSVIDIIDEPHDLPKSETIEETLEDVKAATKEMAIQGMIWGVLLGYEIANPGIRGSHGTILMRLREDCIGYPESTALQLLESYAVEQK